MNSKFKIGDYIVCNHTKWAIQEHGLILAIEPVNNPEVDHFFLLKVFWDSDKRTTTEASDFLEANYDLISTFDFSKTKLKA